MLGVAGYLVTQYATSGSGPARCTVRSGDGREGDTGHAGYQVQPEQAANAATIEAVASSRRLPERAVTIALATAMQESALRNIDHGDRDSLGLFQQRPSQGWGTERQILDPVYAAGKFYDHLVEVPGYSRLPLTVAAQKVQRSGFPQAYAKHEANASLLTAALTGRRPAALNCTTGPGGTPVEAGDPAAVREKLRREFGPDVLGGEDAPQVTGGGRGKPSSAVLVPAASERRGWELAHWALAQAPYLRIAEIAYGGRVWSAARSEEGWRTAGPDGANGTGSAVELRLATGS
ncbi:hypothetical protein [Streptomyces sp. JJ36]|uniref:hypothetical protein n=1 Tax=Streptomyces sp. JJ36 TaxID=2736645 RepID=UPI001F227439|nr:hypothetical protein [Streptomyces sp. JJ36]